VGSQGLPFPLSEYFGVDVFGSTVAAPVWEQYMRAVMAGFDPIEFPEPELATVPSVIGLTEEAARDRLREARFKTTVRSIDSYLTAGTVAEQLPGAGTTTFPGSSVTIFVSTGEAPIVTMPNVVGMAQAEAAALLRARHFVVTIVEKKTNDEELDGIVLGQLPKPGSSVEEGSAVTINVGVLRGGGGGPPSPSPNPDR
jgi:serine/threonine-protein kinase